MKKCLAFLFILMMCLTAYGQEAYNSIATAYVTTTISQNVVFDSTMQQGGTFNFSVLAHNGGGRAGQSDTANVKIQFYTSTNTLVSSVNSSYSANLPNPNAVCGNPCIDSAVPWSTLSISSTLSAAQASTVAYAKISMYGIDGSYWAGDYGPWYRAPTFTLNGGANRAYNPEFGPYNGVTAQGWTSSPGFGACQGAWGGSNACIVNSSGTPGTSTTGLVANQNGGGPSATGGTTSGQAGGYNSTMSTSSPTGAPPLSPTGPIQNVDGGSSTVGLWAGSVGLPNWNGKMVSNIKSGWTWTCNNCVGPQAGTVTGASMGSIGNPNDWMSITLNVASESGATYNFYPPGYAPTVTSTSTSNSVSTTSSTGTSNVTTQYPVSNFNYSFTGTVTTVTDTTTTTPVTTTTWSDGSVTKSNGTSTTSQTVNTTYAITPGQQVSPADLNPYRGTLKNAVYIDQTIGSANNTITAAQKGSGNLIEMQITGTSNQVASTQGYTLNSLNVPIESVVAGTNNFSLSTVSGNNNTVLSQQNGNNNSIISGVTGNYNTVSATQVGNANQSFVTVTGNSNRASINQQGNNNLSATNSQGNGNNITVGQTGNNNSSLVSAVNAGGAVTVNLLQQAVTQGQTFVVQQTCTNGAGCSVSVVQNR